MSERGESPRGERPLVLSGSSAWALVYRGSVLGSSGLSGPGLSGFLHPGAPSSDFRLPGPALTQGGPAETFRSVCSSTTPLTHDDPSSPFSERRKTFRRGGGAVERE